MNATVQTQVDDAIAQLTTRQRDGFLLLGSGVVSEQALGGLRTASKYRMLGLTRRLEGTRHYALTELGKAVLAKVLEITKEEDRVRLGWK